MSEILDEFERKNTRRVYSQLSLMISIVTFGLIFYLLYISPKAIIEGRVHHGPPIISMRLTLLFSLCGLIATIISFVKKEQSNWVKWVGAAINALCFLILLVSIIFARNF